MKHAAVTGAGIGGIASAIRLAANNYQVDVFEAHSGPGGKISEFHQQGFRFDTGPSLFTMPGLVDELFALHGENPRAYFAYRQLQNVTRYFFHDGSIINAWADPQKMADEVERVTGGDRRAFLHYLEKAEALYNMTANIFIFNPFRMKTFMGKDARKAGRNIHKLDAFRTLHQANKSFFNDQRLIKMFDRYATYNGSNPYKTPATLKIISHLEHNTGAYFPEEGMYAIVRQLTALAQRHGVRFHYNTPVEKFDVRNRRVTGIQVNGSRQSYDLYGSNVDVFTLYKQHLPDLKLPRKQAMQELSTSAMIFYWGMAGAYPELQLHNIFFAENYAREFKALFKEHTISDDPTVYLFISKKVVPGDAPENHENWYVMINAPADYGQNWEALRENAREAVLQKLGKMLSRDIRSNILFEKISDPPEIAGRTGSYRGALYGNSSNNRFSAFLRHGNTTKSIKNMYFTGGSVHPGGGIPLCLASAKIATHEITN